MDEIKNEASGVAATLAATDAAPMQRIEIVGERRRAHDATFRARVVSESLAPGARVQELARRHGICTSLIYRWRRLAAPQAGAASAVRLVPVRVTEPRPAATQAAPSRSAADVRRGGVTAIALSGGVRVRVEGEVSLAALLRVIAALRG
jgi:transposase